MNVRVVLAMLVGGCAMQPVSSDDDVPTPVQTPVETPEVVQIELEVVPAPRVSREVGVHPADSVAITDDLVVWFSWSGDLFRQEPGADAVLIEAALDGIVDAAASLEGVGEPGVELVVLDGFAYAWDGLFLRPSPVDDALVGRVVDLTEHRDGLWVETSEGLYGWTTDGLASITVDGAPVTRGVSEGLLNGEPVVWLATDAGLHAAPQAGGSLLASHPVRTGGLAVDGEGTVWVLAQGVLHQVSGEGALLPTDRAGVQTLLEGDGWVWFADAEGWWRGHGSEIAPISDPESALTVDGAGRLWMETEEGFDRLAVDRPVVVGGLRRDGLLDALGTVRVLPTDPDEVASVAVRLDDAPLALSESWAVSLDPAVLDAGVHNLDITVTWLDDEVRSVERSVFVAFPSDVTWATHIEPLHEGRCAPCHANGTETILEDRSSWQMRYDAIVQQVQSGAMPLADTPLTADEISLVVAWGTGGFLP